MFKVHLFNLEYLSITKQLNKKININNIDKLSKKEIKRIGKYIDKKIFYLYKRNLFFEYYDKNKMIDSIFISKINKLIKKLDLKLELFEYKYLNQILEEEFSSRRIKKTIDTNIIFPNNLKNKKPFFVAKNVSVFQKNKLGFLIKKDNYNLYWFNKKVVFTKQQNSFFVINKKDIDEYNLTNIGLEIKLKNKNNYLLIYENNNILKIYFNRF